jgi:urea transporter
MLICGMLALTLVSQFWITPRMVTLRAQVATFDTAATPDQPARVQFDALHAWSTRTEVTVLLLGLAVIYLTASAFSRH